MKSVEIVKEKIDGVLSCLYDRLVVRGKWIKGVHWRGSMADPDCCLMGGVGFCGTPDKNPLGYQFSERYLTRTDRADPPTIHCLATAICTLYPGQVNSIDRRSYMEQGRLSLASAIIVQFNDADNTTLDDVAKVIEKAREYDTILYN